MANQSLSRSLKLSKKFGQELFVGRKFRQSGDVGQSNDFVVHDTGFDLEFVVIFGEFGECFSGGDSVSTKKNGGRTIEERVESISKFFGFFLEGNPEKVVFGDEETGVGFFSFSTKSVLLSRALVISAS